MNAIRIHVHLDSDTPHLPELRPLVGKDVEMTVIEEPSAPSGSLSEALRAFGHLPVDLNALRELREDSII